MKKRFTITEVAELVGVNPRTINREIERGKLSAAKVGRKYVITLADLENYLGKERAKALLENGNGR